MNQKHLVYLACAGLAGLFFVMGVAFIPLTGVQYDEVLFVAAFISPVHIEFNADLFGHNVPLMLMTYLGTLKAFIMQPIFDLAGYNHRTLRFPPLIFATFSVALFFLALRRLVSLRIALITGLLLITDAAYLLTSVYDWGPVALQHLFLCAILYGGVRYSEDGSRRWLILAGFATGLALWDKAVSVWIFAGGGLALMLVFRTEVLRILKQPRLAAALILPALVGGAPLIYYNIAAPMATALKIVSGDNPPMMFKVRTMDGTLNGGGLLGYIVRDVPQGRPLQLRPLQRASLWLSAATGSPRRSFQQVLLVGCFLALPMMLWSPHRRAALLAALAFLFSWALMLLTTGAGGSLHHTILLWPLPQLLAGLTLAELARRMPERGFAVGAAAFLFAIATNLAVVNQHYAQFAAYGPTSTWTNAARPLAEALGRMQGRLAYPVDWGVSQQLDFYGGGRLGLVRGAEGAPLHLDDPDPRRFVEAWLARPELVFVTHTEGNEAFKGVSARLIEAATQLGYHNNLLQVIFDSHGVPIFEIHEFRK